VSIGDSGFPFSPCFLVGADFGGETGEHISDVVEVERGQRGASAAFAYVIVWVWE
jgi:hypothetical protein